LLSIPFYESYKTFLAFKVTGESLMEDKIFYSNMIQANPRGYEAAEIVKPEG
jgi:hypothetical protein